MSLPIFSTYSHWIWTFQTPFTGTGYGTEVDIQPLPDVETEIELDSATEPELAKKRYTALDLPGLRPK